MPQRVPIEKLIQQRLAEDGRSVSWLCRSIGWQRHRWYRFLGNGLIEVGDLYRISLLLNHDFFQHYSLPANCCKIDTKVLQNEHR